VFEPLLFLILVLHHREINILLFVFADDFGKGFDIGFLDSFEGENGN
jgi:hypothetical protein